MQSVGNSLISRSWSSLKLLQALDLVYAECERKGCQWNSAEELLPRSVPCLLVETTPESLHDYLVHMMTVREQEHKRKKSSWSSRKIQKGARGDMSCKHMIYIGLCIRLPLIKQEWVLHIILPRALIIWWEAWYTSSVLYSGCILDLLKSHRKYPYLTTNQISQRLWKYNSGIDFSLLSSLGDSMYNQALETLNYIELYNHLSLF